MQNNDNEISQDPVIAIVQLHTRMVSIDNHIRDSKQNMKNLGDKLDSFKDFLKTHVDDRIQTVVNHIQHVDDKYSKKYEQLNFRMGLIFGGSMAIPLIMQFIMERFK